MYWFFDKGGPDDKGDLQKDIHWSTPQIHKNFNFQLPFFGFRFNYTRVKQEKKFFLSLILKFSSFLFIYLFVILVVFKRIFRI